jgi:hypothetical protein
MIRDDEIAEAVDFLHKGYEPTGKIFIAHEGKNHYFKVNRRQMFLLAAAIHTALANMEPGEWRRAHEEAA